jgi:peptidoglycan hydrolase-like protein with peptidoglycan-binding domain
MRTGVDGAGYLAAGVRRHRRALVIAMAGLVAVALVAGGWLTASAFESPAQRDAAASPPPSGPITARVEQGDLVRTTTLRATAQRAARAEAVVPAQEGDTAVVTANPVVANGEVDAGRAVIEVNGIRLIALPGAFAFYRDLRPGDRGPDVDQLQRGLVAAGRLTNHDGVFGRATERAVRAMYAAAGTPLGEETVPPEQPPAASTNENATPPTRTRIVVERSRLVVFSSLPAHLTATLPIGTAMTPESTLRYESGAVQLTAQVSSTAATGLRVGTTGSLVQGGRSVRIAAVGTAGANGGDAAASDAEPSAGAPTASDAGSAGDATVVVVGDSAALPDDLLGKDVLVELTIDVAAKDSLLVPSVALTPHGSRPARIAVRQSDGSFRQVDVRERASLDGTSAFEPVDPGAVGAGDVVRVR